MNGFTLALIAIAIGFAAAWWRTEGQLQRAERRLSRAEYRLAQQRLRIRQLTYDRDRAYDHADQATALLTETTPVLRLVEDSP